MHTLTLHAWLYRRPLSLGEGSGLCSGVEMEWVSCMMYVQYALQSSRILLDTPILAGLAAVYSNYHGFAIYIYSLESVSSRVPPLL
jgi:hypothetical protein